jgi:hypothetical protein
MVLASAIAVPLQQMAFALHFVLPGKLYQPIVYTDGPPPWACRCHAADDVGVGASAGTKHGSRMSAAVLRVGTRSRIGVAMRNTAMRHAVGTMRLEIPTPFLESLNGN